MYVLALMSTLIMCSQLVAAQKVNNLSLDITPSPFSVNLKPGVETTLGIQIRNKSSVAEKLKIEAKPLNVKESGEVSVDFAKTPDIISLVDFKTPQFTLGSGEWSNQEIVLKIPEESKYNYSFAIVISRQQDSVKKSGDLKNKDKVFVPVLINVDRSGHLRKLEVQKFSSTAGIYVKLPVNFDLKIKNTGNMIVKPSGNVVIQRGSNDKKPVATIPINASKDYIVPGNSRTFAVAWKGSDMNKTPTIGLYTAKLSATYNDGVKDIQIEREVTFWLFPWKTILAIIALLLSILFAAWFMLRKYNKLPKIRKRSKQSNQN